VKKDYIQSLYENPVYYDTVQNIILRTMSSGISKHDLEDCISEVWLIALKKRREVEKHPCIQGWLVTTAKYVARRFWNRKFLEKKMITDDDVELEALDNSAEEKKRYDELLEMLKKNLKPSEFRIFTMKFIQKCSTAEIGEELGLSQTAVDSRINRLRTKIKIILNEP